MAMKWIRRVLFGGLALYFFYAAWEAVQQAGVTSQSLIPAAVGAAFGVLAVLGKGG
jgi:hypothetical protein